MGHSRYKKMIRMVALMLALCMVTASTPAYATGVETEYAAETAAEESGEVTESETAESETTSGNEKFTWSTDQIAEETEDIAIEQPETESKKSKKTKKTEAVTEEETESVEETIEEETEETIVEEDPTTNEELIAAQNIVVPEPGKEDEFRFTWDQNAEQAILIQGAKVYESTFVEPTEESALTYWSAPDVVGISLTGSQVYILESNITVEGSEEAWLYIESGSVRGFVRESDLVRGEEAIEAYLRETYADQLAELEDEKTEAEESLSILVEVSDDAEADEAAFEEAMDAVNEVQQEEAAEEERSLWEICGDWMLDCYATVTTMNNSAVDYTLTTGSNPVVDKVYAIAKKDVQIYGQKNIFAEDAEVVGTLAAGGVAYILDDSGSLIVYVESGDVRGFAAAKDFYRGKKAKKELKEYPEETRAVAEALVEPEKNPALYYTLTSTQEAEPYSALRKAMIQFALQFVGNPYVWGGTDLLNGADCSGFVQQIYKTYGISIPRTSREQSKVGLQIPVEEALPGDLIFYARNGVVYHVTMYMGDGRVVQAANHVAGIITSPIGSNAVWACRILY